VVCKAILRLVVLQLCPLLLHVLSVFVHININIGCCNQGCGVGRNFGGVRVRESKNVLTWTESEGILVDSESVKMYRL
jgi:hypothetical protein